MFMTKYLTIIIILFFLLTSCSNLKRKKAIDGVIFENTQLYGFYSEKIKEKLELISQINTDSASFWHELNTKSLNKHELQFVNIAAEHIKTSKKTILIAYNNIVDSVNYIFRNNVLFINEINSSNLNADKIKQIWQDKYSITCNILSRQGVQIKLFKEFQKMQTDIFNNIKASKYNAINVDTIRSRNIQNRNKQKDFMKFILK